jgi:ABC-type Na+ transport system ATPase subunit NatA
MIRIENLTKRFGKTLAVDRIDLHVPPGEVMGFLGPNGAGKTTTIRMLAGLMKPDTGTIILGGHNLATEPEKAKAITGFVPDRPYLYEKLTGWEFLQFSAGIYGVDPGDLEKLGTQYLEMFERRLEARAYRDITRYEATAYHQCRAASPSEDFYYRRANGGIGSQGCPVGEGPLHANGSQPRDGGIPVNTYACGG